MRTRTLALGAVAVLVALAVLPAATRRGAARAFFTTQPPVDHYLVGAATRDITPTGETNLGGFGLGDGSVLPSAVIGPGHRAGPGAEHIAVRALVVEGPGTPPVAIATIETQGMFAAYKTGDHWGLHDIAGLIAAAQPRLVPDHIVLAADHTHSGPDTIGAWGFVPDEYMNRVRDAAVGAVLDAYAARSEATLVYGRSDAPDLVYNQNCTEAVNQSPQPAYTGPTACDQPDQDVKDAFVRVLQARAVSDGHVLTTLVSYNSHATLGGASGIHGDWPQFLSDALSARLGGVGIAMEGAVGRMQPCRPQCSFTDPAQFGGATDRKTAYVNALLSHVQAALADAQPVAGTVVARQQFIREPVTDPAVLALFGLGKHAGAELRRSLDSPWMAGPTIGTPVSTVLLGNLLISAFPGEAYPNIPVGVTAAVADGAVLDNLPLGLANDQLGYLIAPAEAWPLVAAEVAVNDNSVFNVSQTIGDHVMCASIENALTFLPGTPPARCAPYLAEDRAGDPLGATGVGGPPSP